MKVAYLILTHNNPEVLKRAIGVLSSEHCKFFIHVDQKSTSDFSGIRGTNVHFSDVRLPVYWGEFSIVAATLLLMRRAMDSLRDADYFVLMSGSDYPLRSEEYIRDFLSANRGSEFMNFVKVPAPGKPLSRINTLRFPSTKPIRRFASRALAKLGLGRRDYRKYLGSMEPYSGGQWWALTRDACRYILEFVTRNQDVVTFFENMFAADEAFFQIILGNSPFRSQIRRNLVYEDWTGSIAHPVMINDHHVTFFEGQTEVRVKDIYGHEEMLFARKFSDSNLELLERMDEMIEAKERHKERRGAFESDKAASGRRR